MKKFFIASVCMLAVLFLAGAAERRVSEASVHGHVLDKDTGEHVPFLLVSLKGTTIATTTGDSGHYFLEHLPEGKFILQVSGIGYKTSEIEVELKDGISLEVNFQLEEDVVLLDGVVVSANRSETTRRMAPTLVNVVNMDTYDKVNATSLSQGLVFQPGVRVENNCQNCSYQQVRINGLDGPYTQILIDSRPVFSALAGVYGIEQLPANMVDRVEVMRGGGSALFGSSAIAGTINIITREPVRNSASISHSISSLNGTGAFDNNTSLNASLVTEDNKMGIAVFGQNRHKDGYDHDGDGFTELTEMNGQTLGMRGYIKTGLYSKLTAEYHHLQEYRRGGDNLHLPPHEVMIAEQVRHGINTGSLKYEWFSRDERHRFNVFGSVQHINRESYYGAGMDPDAYGETEDLTWVIGGQYVHKFENCIFMPADLTAGVEYNQDHLEDNMWGYNRVIDQVVRIGSMYLQNEWKNAKWSFLLGGRLDKHNLIDGMIFSPRANLRYNPVENVNLRASYSFGFRAPQAFDEDLHIDNVGGTVSMIRLADDLRVEKSQSVSISADIYHSWGSWQGNILVEGFFTDLSDVFALTETGYENGVLIKERRNESGAQVYGGNIEGKIAYKSLWQFQAGVTFQNSAYKEARAWADDVEATAAMFRTPDFYGYFVTSCNPLKRLMLSLSGTYTGSMLVEHHAGWIDSNRTEKTPGFFDMNFKAAYDFKLYNNIKLQLNAGVQNIFNAFQNDFDQGPDRDSGYIYGPAAPRSFYLGVKLSY
ncbi:MAG: TonB-dependent receptor [Bacteroidales bacterium]|nr:TonB-dependent receptor [Bacteroidales bacterium]